MFSLRSGLGQVVEHPAVVPPDLLARLDKAGKDIALGLREWTRLQRIDYMTEGDNLLSRYHTIRRQLLQWGIDDLPDLKALIPLFAIEAREYLSKAKQELRQKEIDTARAEGAPAPASSFELPELPWWIWIVAGLGAYLVLRR